jgi:hypothetical protein
VEEARGTTEFHLLPSTRPAAPSLASVLLSFQKHQAPALVQLCCLLSERHLSAHAFGNTLLYFADTKCCHQSNFLLDLSLKAESFVIPAQFLKILNPLTSTFRLHPVHRGCFPLLFVCSTDLMPPELTRIKPPMHTRTKFQCFATIRSELRSHALVAFHGLCPTRPSSDDN